MLQKISSYFHLSVSFDTKMIKGAQNLYVYIAHVRFFGINLKVKPIKIKNLLMGFLTKLTQTNKLIMIRLINLFYADYAVNS